MDSTPVVCVINGSNRRKSRTLSLSQEAKHVADAYSSEPEVLDLRELQMEFFDGREIEEYNEDTRQAIQSVLAADVLVYCSPVYFGGISGGMKNLIDLIPYEEFSATERSAGMIMTGRDNRHQALLDTQLRATLVYLGLRVATTGVFATEDDFNDYTLTNSSIKDWIQTMMTEAIDLWAMAT